MLILNDNINPVREMVKTFNKDDNIIIVKFLYFVLILESFLYPQEEINQKIRKLPYSELGPI